MKRRSVDPTAVTSADAASVPWAVDRRGERRGDARRAAEDPLTPVVVRLTSGDEAAFSEAYRAIHPGLLRYLTVLVGVDDAEDVGSEAWAQACRDLARFDGDGDGFRGWVTTIARHRALDHLRARGRRPVVAASVEDLPDRPGGEDAAESAMAVLSTRAALALIAQLPQEQAEAVLLRTVVGLDAPAAAAVLGKRPGAVRMATHRGLRALSDLLADGPAGSGDTSGALDAGEVR